MRRDLRRRRRWSRFATGVADIAFKVLNMFTSMCVESIRTPAGKDEKP